MGKKDKHKAGQSRNHPVFKVMGNTGKVANKSKQQKTQEVKTKLKKLSLPNKSKTKDTIDSLDSQFKSIQQNSSISISASKDKPDQTRQKIIPMSGVLNEPNVDMDGLMTSMEKLKETK